MKTGTSIDIDNVSPRRLRSWVKFELRTGDELALACGKFVEVDRVIASHPNVTSQLLEKLSHSSDRATRARVVANPNTPTAAYLRLGEQFPKEFLANPMLDLLLLENPALLDGVPTSLLVRLLKKDGCPEEFLVWAAGYNDQKVQLAVATNSAAPAEALSRLKVSHYARVRETVQSRMHFSSNALQDPELAYREAVKARLQALCPTDALQAWSKKDIGIAQYAYLSLAARLTLSGVDWLQALETQKFPLGILDALSHDTSVAIRQVVAENWHTMPEALERLSKDNDWLIRSSVAGNRSAPTQILEVLARDSEECVRLKVAENQATPLLVLESLLSDLDTQVCMAAKVTLAQRSRTCIGPVMSPSSESESSKGVDTTEDVRQALMQVGEVGDDVRKRLAESAETPPYVLKVLVGDESSDVIVAVAANPNTPQDVLHALAKRPKVEVLRSLLRNPALPHSILQRLATTRIDGLRRELARCNSTPAWILESLGNDCDDPKVLSALIMHSASGSNLVEKICEKLGHPLNGCWYKKHLARVPLAAQEAATLGNIFYFNGTNANRSLLAKRPLAALMALNGGDYLEPTRIVRVVGSSDWLVRAAVARNRHTPLNLVKRLALDVHPLVSALAEARLAAPDGDVTRSGSADQVMTQTGAGTFLSEPSLPATQMQVMTDFDLSGLRLSSPCPNCDGLVEVKEQRCTCVGSGVGDGCGFSIGTVPAGRSLEIDEVESLLMNKLIGPLKFRTKAGSPFNATLRLVRDDDLGNWRPEFCFDDDPSLAEKNPAEKSFGLPLGSCPKCKGQVFETQTSYACEYAGGTEPTCDFKTSKTILQQPVSPEEMGRLLTTGRTSVLTNFVSNRTRRKFKASLVWNHQEGKLGFELEQQRALHSALQQWMRDLSATNHVTN